LANENTCLKQMVADCCFLNAEFSLTHFYKFKFYSAYTLETSSSETQQTKSVGVIINGDRQMSSLEHGTAENV